MVSAVEQKFRATSNGTKFTDYQPFMMNGVMILYSLSITRTRIYFLFHTIFQSILFISEIMGKRQRTNLKHKPVYYRIAFLFLSEYKSSEKR